MWFPLNGRWGVGAPSNPVADVALEVLPGALTKRKREKERPGDGGIKMLDELIIPNLTASRDAIKRPAGLSMSVSTFHVCICNLRLNVLWIKLIASYFLTMYQVFMW